MHSPTVHPMGPDSAIPGQAVGPWGTVDTSPPPCEAQQAHAGPRREPFKTALCMVVASSCHHVAVAIS